jgi:hypothetical protein
MRPCITCSGRPGRLGICQPCVERAESILHMPLPWTPFQRATIHPDLEKEGFEACWKNSRYTVVGRNVKSDIGNLVHLSIKRNDKNPLHDWRDLQRIKNEILGPEEEAVELYPAESRLVDGANQYHLWSFVGQKIPVGYTTERCVMLPGGMDGSKQRPFEDPPKDVMTEEQFQEKLKQHNSRSLARAGLIGQMKSILEGAAALGCQNPFRYTDNRLCEAVKPKNPEMWCGYCMAKLLCGLSRELEQL